MKILLFTCLWGETYVDDFLNVVLRSWISKNNLGNPEVAKDIDVLIKTDDKDVNTIKNHPNFIELNELVTVNLESQSLARGGESWQQMYTVINPTVTDNEIQEKYTGIMIAYPDSVLSDGYLTVVHNKARTYKIVYTWGNIRVNRDSFKEEIMEYIQDGIDSRTLSKLAMKHAHIHTKAHMMDDYKCITQELYIWKVNDDCWLIRSMHHFPTYASIECYKSMGGRHSFYETHLSTINVSPEEIYTFDDSDDALMVDITLTEPLDGKIRAIKSKPYDNVIIYELLHTEYIKKIPISKKPLDKVYRLHTNDNFENWNPTLKESHSFIKGFYDEYGHKGVNSR